MDRLTLVKLALAQRKQAGVMSQERREELPSKAFAVPESKAKKIGVGDEVKGEAKGKYPIPDEKHARNALARVSQHGTPAEREAVRKKVYSKYPQLKEGFKERHGESPTSKENVKKVEQGGIGKESDCGVKHASIASFADEMQKIAAVQKLAATGLSFDQLIKVAEFNPEIYELLKQAGIFSRMGEWMQRKGAPGIRNAYNRAQVGMGDLMQRYGHGMEHGGQELLLTTSPLKGGIAALASDPHLRADIGRVTGLTAAGKAIGRGAKKGYQATVRGMGKLKPAPGRIGPGGPPPVPAFA